MISVREVKVGSSEHLQMVHIAFGLEPTEGVRIMRQALVPAAGARILIAVKDGALVGAMSFRFDDAGGIKRISTGVIKPRQRIGTTLAWFLRQMYPGIRQWCKSVESANPWCEFLGMKRDAPLYVGDKKAYIYIWEAT